MSSTSTSRHSRPSVMSSIARGAIGGILAGIPFILVTMWFAASMGNPAQGPLMAISTIVLGGDAVQTGAANAGVGLVVHIVLSAVLGIVFGLLAARLRSDAVIAVAGTVYGALLYVVNFLVIAPIAFPALEMANQPFELFAHLVFGNLLSFALFSWGRSAR
jgi:uncharacterized membrane protein YagU involved in acid resistance